MSQRICDRCVVLCPDGNARWPLFSGMVEGLYRPNSVVRRHQRWYLTIHPFIGY